MKAVVSLHLGEMHTGLVQNSTELSAASTVALLRLIPQSTVRTWERPVRHAASPLLLTGIDGELPSTSGARLRVIGTVGAEARVTGGRLLQCSAETFVRSADVHRRLPWTEYLTRPGVLEAHGNLRVEDVATAFLSRSARPHVLDLGGICAHLAGLVQSSDLVDHASPFPAARTTLRWAAQDADASSSPTIRMTLESPTVRWVHIRVPSKLMPQVSELLRDVALHDWLLSAVVAIVDLARIGRQGRPEVVRQLQPAIDHLLHLWMPRARIESEMEPFWNEIERRSGLSRQWAATIRRIRDQVSLVGLEPVVVDLAAARAGARST